MNHKVLDHIKFIPIIMSASMSSLSLNSSLPAILLDVNYSLDAASLYLSFEGESMGGRTGQTMAVKPRRPHTIIEYTVSVAVQ